ncbi:MAG TPA: GntR family transcriptional regulator [Candidatus Saccharimonadales bacterium]|nr:GntR family transcriptional regulator [Candidatus Saccharimonadales bacterium]
MIIFRIDPQTGVSPYLQIVQQAKQALRMGTLVPGDQLPTVKEVVSYLAINPNTVFKAYRELESMGLVEGRKGSGTFAIGRPTAMPAETIEQLAAGVAAWLDEAIEAGLDDEAIQALVADSLQRKNIKEST